MMVSRLVSTVRFISARRVWPSVSSTRDQRAGVIELLAVLGQEFGGRDEQRTGQTCVGVRARFL